MPAAKKDKFKLYGLSLIKDRFEATKNEKKGVERKSVVEHSNLGNLSEKLDWKNCDGEAIIDEKYASIIGSLNFDLSIPPRVPFYGINREDYQALERSVFNRWKQAHASKIFERNLEIWRQFWIVCERSDVLVQIVDARNIDFFINTDIWRLYPNKKHVVLCNKADLVGEERQRSLEKQIRDGNVDAYLYSATDMEFGYKFSGVVGLIGYPNVGKSSTINLILKRKKVCVSSTPGKTKHFQTLKTDDFLIHDCPGLVFPKHEKIDLVINGIINVDHVLQLMKYENEIIEKIGHEKIRKAYKIKEDSCDLLDVISREKVLQKSDCLKMLLKDHINGFV